MFENVKQRVNINTKFRNKNPTLTNERITNKYRSNKKGKITHIPSYLLIVRSRY